MNIEIDEIVDDNTLTERDLWLNDVWEVLRELPKLPKGLEAKVLEAIESLEKLQKWIIEKEKENE